MAFRFQLKALMTLFLAAVFGYGFLALMNQDFVVRAFPWMVSILALLLLLRQLVLDLWKRNERSETEDTGGQIDLEFSPEEATVTARRRTVEIFAWLYGFLGALWAFGFHLAFPLLAFLYLLRHRVPWPAVAIMTFVFWLVIRVVFQELLHVPIPPGALVDLRQVLP